MGSTSTAFATECRHTNKYLDDTLVDVEEKLVEDARKLLSLGVGDQHILKQILRAATNNEIISNRERSYVTSLIEEHTATGDKPTVQSSGRKVSHVLKQESGPSKSSNKTIIIGIIAGIAAAAVAIPFIVMPETPGTVSPDPVIMMTLNAPSYVAGDFIDIRGTTDLEPGSVVRMTIRDFEMTPVWSWETITDSDGSFSALALAGYGDWQPGTYTITAVYNDQMHQYEFEYIG